MKGRKVQQAARTAVRYLLQFNERLAKPREFHFQPKADCTDFAKILARLPTAGLVPTYAKND